MSNYRAYTFSEFINEQERWLDVGKSETQGGYYYPPKEVTGKIRVDDTNKYKILRFIYTKGKEGVRYTDIVKYIVEELKGMGCYDYKKHRGYYSCLLSGTYSVVGVLPTYCTKNKNNKWVLTNKALLKHFKDKESTGDLGTEWSEFVAKRKGWDQDDIDVYREFGILGDMVKD